MKCGARYSQLSMRRYSLSHAIPDDLLQRYDVPGPRYTSYPTADRFVEAFGELDYIQALVRRRSAGSATPLSLYVHIPFCDSVCYYLSLIHI